MPRPGSSRARRAPQKPSRPAGQQARRKGAEPGPVRGEPARTGAEGVLQLQRQAGNAAVNALLQRVPAGMLQRGLLGDIWEGIKAVGSAIGDAVGDVLDVRKNEEYLDALEDKKRFVQKGIRGPKALRAPTGIGGFSASFDPEKKELLIELAGGVAFTDSMAIDASGNVTATVANARVTTAVTQIMALPVADRAAAVAAFQWQEDQKGAWLGQFESSVEGVWSGQFTFHSSKKYWEDLEATAKVDVKVHAGAKTKDEHMSLTVYKVPENFAIGVGVVQSGGGGATANTMILGSADVKPRSDNLLAFLSTRFTSGSSTLDAVGIASVQQAAGTYAAGLNPSCNTCGKNIPGIEGPSVRVVCHGEGKRPQRRAKQRFEAIKAEMVNAGFHRPDDRLVYEYGGRTPRGVNPTCRYIVDTGVAQIVAAHEAGHMFGLGDEYAVGGAISGTGAAPGSPTKHDQLVKDMGLDGSVFENNDNIMSIGNVLRPQHAATFIWAIKDITEMPEWEFGPGHPVEPPAETSGPGDFPVPTGDTRVA